MDGEKPPLHIGEAYNLWYYLAGTTQSLRNSEVGYNTARDSDLRDRLQDLMRDVHHPIISETTDDKPQADFKNIPDGARLTDEEIATTIIFNELMGTQIAVRGLTEAVRADVGAMFSKYLVMKATWGITMKNLMQKKGWLLIPPYINKP
jgi:hypothetical protein